MQDRAEHINLESAATRELVAAEGSSTREDIHSIAIMVFVGLGALVYNVSVLAAAGMLVMVALSAMRMLGCGAMRRKHRRAYEDYAAAATDLGDKIR